LARKENILEVDFHHYYVEDALLVVESIVGQIRLGGKEAHCRFITGSGKIRSAILELLEGPYELKPVIPMANTGTVEVYVS